MNKFALKINPELSYVLPPGFEVTQDLVNRRHTSGWMAVMHFASDDGFAACEDAVWAFRKEGHTVASVYEGESSGGVPKIPTSCSKLTLPVGNIRAPV